MKFRFRKQLAVLLAVACLQCFALSQSDFRQVSKTVIETRLKKVVYVNAMREQVIKQLFADSGCGKRLSEQAVGGKLPPNVICVLPGTTDKAIIVGAHTDKVSRGDGVVDNWSGAALLPSLYFSLSGQARKHTYIFVGFAGEEIGLIGSDYFVNHLSPDERAKVDAMVNMDTLGLGPTKVWESHADKELAHALTTAAVAQHLQISVSNVDNLGSTDSESFAEFNIPRITIHSVTKETWPILHSIRDRMDAVKMADYYDSYKLIAGYLAYLDTDLGQKATQPQKSTP